MFGIRKQQTSSSMTIFYLFVLLLILNQFLFVRSFRLMNDDFNQNEDDDVRRALLRQLALENFVSPVEDALYNEKVVALPVESTVQHFRSILLYESTQWSKTFNKRFNPTTNGESKGITTFCYSVRKHAILAHIILIYRCQ
ncbi:unnamed protein product [Adineta ricciae]|uniref:Uncharacterized protein n=1 Tax=Adineta ricciae TaxID=249248 RepID=A0A813ZWL3_ADIRI|nr:unnamed protein product [Adineta ricciae]